MAENPPPRGAPVQVNHSGSGDGFPIRWRSRWALSDHLAGAGETLRHTYGQVRSESWPTAANRCRVGVGGHPPFARMVHLLAVCVALWAPITSGSKEDDPWHLRRLWLGRWLTAWPGRAGRQELLDGCAAPASMAWTTDRPQILVVITAAVGALDDVVDLELVGGQRLAPADTHTVDVQLAHELVALEHSRADVLVEPACACAPCTFGAVAALLVCGPAVLGAVPGTVRYEARASEGAAQVRCSWHVAQPISLVRSTFRTRVCVAQVWVWAAV